MFKAGVKKVGVNGGWRGVIRNAKGAVVWECPHCHKNRDQTTHTSGTSAGDCARGHLTAATNPEYGMALKTMPHYAVRPEWAHRMNFYIEQAPAVRQALGL